MKVFHFFFYLLFSISACTNTTVTDNSNELEKNNKDSSEILCFQRLDGLITKDTTSIRLVINDNKVTGDMMYLPHEKDSRIGKITCIKQGNIIKGIWIYMQEGILDTLSMEFKLNGNTLMQKNYNLDKTGRRFLTDTSRFGTEYKKIDCSSFSKHSF